VGRRERGIERYHTPSGELRYRVRWWEAGKHRSRSFRALGGEHGARAFHRKMRQAQEAGARVAYAGAQELTLAAFAADVWAPRAKRRLAPKTWKRDRAVYNKHILHQLGAHPIAGIDAEDLVGWQDSLEAAGVGAPTVIKAISILSSVFREAARRSRTSGVRANPVVLLDKPSAKRRRRPLVWGPVVVERVRHQLLLSSRRINPEKDLMALRDAMLVGLMAMSGCRPGEALALRWTDLDGRISIGQTLSGDEIVDRTKTGAGRIAPLLEPLSADADALRKLSRGSAEDFVFATPAGEHWTETDWRNFRSRHFLPALQRVEGEWEGWRRDLPSSDGVRESVTGLSATRPYDLGRHTHSAMMLASGMSLQRLARIQGHSIRVLDETYSEQLFEYAERSEPIDPVAEIAKARTLVWGERDPSSGR